MSPPSPYKSTSQLRDASREIRLAAFISPSQNDSAKCDRAHAPGRIHLSLITIELSKAPTYEALSYLWGDASVAENVVLNDSEITVTKNLHTCLRVLRNRNDVGYLWIDAICIDQTSVEEKNTQVPLMRDIYSGARCVFIWLGPHADDSERAMSMLRRWGEGLEAASPSGTFYTETVIRAVDGIEDPFNEEDLAAVESLCSRQYWSRVWIMQEVVLANDALVLCGEDEVNYRLVRTTLQLWYHWNRLGVGHLNNASAKIKFATMGSATNITTVNSLALERRKAKNAGEDVPCTSILSLIRGARSSQATDPRDKIFGVYGLFGSQKVPLNPNYTLNTEEVYTQFTAGYILMTENLDVVSLSGIGTYKEDGELELPSWVPDYSRMTASVPFSYIEHASYRADRGTTPSFTLSNTLKDVTARGIVCDEVADLSPGWKCPGTDSDFLWSWNSLAASRKHEIRPQHLPWRQVFFRNVIADFVSDENDHTVFQSVDHEDWFMTRAHGFFSMMRWKALLDAWGAIRGQEARTGEVIMKPVKDDTEVCFDAGKFTDTDGLDEETLYWIRNSSDTSDESMRQRALDEFIGEEGANCRLNWPFDHYPDQVEFSPNFARFTDVMTIVCGTRNFIITKRGYLGVAPFGTKKGDSICVLYGCPLPLVIRSAGTAWKIVGDAHVYGMMNGEMIAELKEGTLAEDDLTFS